MGCACAEKVTHYRKKFFIFYPLSTIPYPIAHRTLVTTLAREIREPEKP